MHQIQIHIIPAAEEDLHTVSDDCACQPAERSRTGNCATFSHRKINKGGDDEFVLRATDKHTQ